MRKKSGLIILGLSSVGRAYASDNGLFQGLDNQIAVGIGYSNISTYNSTNSATDYTTNASLFSMRLEQLFDSNVWLAIDGSFMAAGSQSGPDNGFSQNVQMLGQPAQIGIKGGYSFNWSSLGLQIIPYLNLGRELNYNGAAIMQGGFTSSAYTDFGGGGRVEYVFTPRASIYFDQNISYLNAANNNPYNLNALSYTSALGIRFNAAQQFQIAAQANYNHMNLTDNSGYNSTTFTYQNTLQNTLGGTIYFAYLFDPQNDPNSPRNNSNYADPILADFDNSYSVGFGYISSKNNYSGGNQPAVSTGADYLNVNVSHLFENNVWASVNAQLLNQINQTSVPTGQVSSYVPTYIGFPGNVQANVGYAFGLQSAVVQFIPYANAGIVENINSYTLPQNTSIMNAVSQDMYFQYGIGGRAEYAINSFFQIYADQLIAGMQDHSRLAINAWRSTSSLGVKLDPGSKIQIGFKGFYDTINPVANAYNSGSNTYYAAQQNSLGGEVDLGLRY